MLRELVAAGADLAQTTRAGATPLLLAAGRGHLGVLLAFGKADAGKLVRNPFYGKEKLRWHLVPFFPRDGPLKSLKPPAPAPAEAEEAGAGAEEAGAEARAEEGAEETEEGKMGGCDD